MRFHLFSGNFEDVSAQLESGLVDFGLFVGDAVFSKYDYIKLPCYDVRGLLMRSDCPLASRATIKPADLETVPLLCSRQAIYSNELSGWLGHDFGDLDIVSTHNLVHNSAMMTEADMGSVVTIAGLINTAGTDLDFRPLEPTLKAQLSFAWKPSRPLSRAAAELLRTLQSRIA